MPAPPRTARGRETRRKILEAATELVRSEGVAATSLDDVRRRAGASKSQLYLYFPDREALLREVAGATADEVMEQQAEPLGDLDTMAGLERYLDGLVAYQVELAAHGGCPIATLGGQLAERDEQARLALADGLTRWHSGLADGLRAMDARGELRDGADVDALATQALALVQGGLVLTQMHRDPGQLRTAADGVLALVRARRRDG